LVFRSSLGKKEGIMTSLLSIFLVLLGVGQDPKESPRPPSSIAPSLPQLTPEEEDKLDALIDRFIQADIGRLRGEEGNKAKSDFEKLGPEAIPALIRGLNRAAKIETSCPALVIARKLDRMLQASEDRELLEFAWDNIGIGVGRTRHSGTLNDLKVKVMVRKGRLARQPPKGPKAPRSMTLTELAEAASIERGDRLKLVLTELEKRSGPEVLSGLCLAAEGYERDVQSLGRNLLEKHLSRQPAGFVKDKLQDPREEVRRATARAIGSKFPTLAGDLIDRLGDDSAEVRAAAHEALVRLAKGEDFGPAGTSVEEREEARKKWRAWWEAKKSR
jgi:hypothetical protein